MIVDPALIIDKLVFCINDNSYDALSWLATITSFYEAILSEADALIQ